MFRKRCYCVYVYEKDFISTECCKWVIDGHQFFAVVFVGCNSNGKCESDI